MSRLPRLPLLLVGSLLLGACSTDAEDIKLAVDVTRCLQAARDSACGDSLGDAISDSTWACLVLEAKSGAATYEYAYDPASKMLNLVRVIGGSDLTVAAGEFVKVEVLVLQPDAAGCPAVEAIGACDQHPDVCLLSFGEEQARMEGDSVSIAYGGAAGEGCEIECQDDCGPELCNGLDDDCDGEVDEDFQIQGACIELGNCGEGLTECNAAGDGVLCSVGPGGSEDRHEAEVCDGVDNDCDGETDELADLDEAGITGVDCGTNLGTCRFGRTACQSGAVVCIGPVEPGLEICDELDNDCDGETDEGFRYEDFGEFLPPGDPCTGRGECGEGFIVCAVDQASACCGADPSCRDVGSEEECDGLDNDCDGQTDEIEDLVARAIVGRVCGSGLGECALGTSQCQGGELVCAGEVKPVDELCDLLDNDCDGAADEREDLAADGIVGIQCGEGRGECNQGILECLTGRLVCQGEGLPGAETCDGLDNDCDGVVDEARALLDRGEIGIPCGTDVGLCELGEAACVGGEIVCPDDIEPADELCDNLDNDCDGVADNGFDLGSACDAGGDCGSGQSICNQDGNGTCCGADPICNPGIVVGEEVCDGVDNDCNGLVDDNLGRGDLPVEQRTGVFCGPALGECRQGIQQCLQGHLVCEGGRGPEPEECDGDDNDCDDEVDEADEADGGGALTRACYSGDEEELGLGLCRRGTETCAEGRWGGACVGEILPDVEDCDGDDEDCDGLVDEDDDGEPLRQDCYTGADGTEGHGPCEGGTVACAEGAFSDAPEDCEDQVVPTDEVCNGFDDDCDDNTDEAIPEVGEGCGIEECDVDGASRGLYVCDVIGGVKRLACEPAFRLANAVDAACADFVRNTPATFAVDGDPPIAHVNVGELRFQHAPETAPPAAYPLIEGQRLNLLYDTDTPGVNEEEAETNAWILHTQGGAEDTTAAVIEAGAPDGGSFSEVLFPDDRGGIRLYQNGLTANDAPVVHSAWLKSATGALVSQRAAPTYDWPLTTEWVRLFAEGSRRDDRTRVELRRWDDLTGEPFTADLSMWGVQIEEGAFASSYIPRRTFDSAGLREADSLTVPRELLGMSEGSYLTWFRPMYAATEDDEPHGLLWAGGAVTIEHDATGGNPVLRCEVEGVIAEAAADFAAGTWQFVACTWHEDEGVRLYVEDDQGDIDKTETLVGFPPPDAPEVSLRIAPAWSLVGEVALHRLRLTDQAVTDFVAETGDHYP